MTHTADTTRDLYMDHYGNPVDGPAKDCTVVTYKVTPPANQGVDPILWEFEIARCCGRTEFTALSSVSPSSFHPRPSTSV